MSEKITDLQKETRKRGRKKKVRIHEENTIDEMVATTTHESNVEFVSMTSLLNVLLMFLTLNLSLLLTLLMLSLPLLPYSLLKNLLLFKSL
jgi:hypothetical protein